MTTNEQDNMKNLLLLQTFMIILLLFAISCSCVHKMQKPSFCHSSNLIIDEKKWIKIAKQHFEEEFESYDTTTKKYFASLYNTISIDLDFLYKNNFYQNNIQKYAQPLVEFDEFSKICFVYYSYEGEVAESISAILWMRRYENLYGILIDNNNKINYIRYANSKYKKIRKSNTIKKPHATILGSFILLIEVDCNNNIWTKIIMEPDLYQDRMVYKLLGR